MTGILMEPGASVSWETNWDDVSCAMVSSHMPCFRRGGTPQISLRSHMVPLSSRRWIPGVETNWIGKLLSLRTALACQMLSMEVANCNVQSGRYAGTIRFLDRA